MEEFEHNGQELEELWVAKTAQDSQNAGVLRYHGAIISLHEKAQKDYSVKGGLSA